MNRLASPRFLLGATFVIVIVVTASVGNRLAVNKDSALTCVVEDTRSGGGAGIRAWAQKLGYTTVALRPPLREVGSQLRQPGNCLITAGNGPWNPFGAAFADEDWHAISRWVRSGNVLIVIASEVTKLPSQIKEHFTHRPPNQEDSKSPPVIAASKRIPFAMENTYERVPTWWGGDLLVNAEGPRLKQIPQEWKLAGRSDEAVLAGRPDGDGMIYLLLDEFAWTNAGFDSADNAVTLARILKRRLGPAGVLAFDEYRHGYGRIESFSSLFLSLPGGKDFALMAFAWGLFWLWSRTRRLSPADEFQDDERRTAMEYIESVAAMNQRARAAPLTLQAVVRRVRYLLQKRGNSNAEATSVLDRASQYESLGQRPAVPAKEIKIVWELIQLRRRLHGTRRDPRAD